VTVNFSRRSLFHGVIELVVYFIKFLYTLIKFHISFVTELMMGVNLSCNCGLPYFIVEYRDTNILKIIFRSEYVVTKFLRSIGTKAV
jgi:hypothetical protein